MTLPSAGRSPRRRLECCGDLGPPRFLLFDRRGARPAARRRGVRPRGPRHGRSDHPRTSWSRSGVPEALVQRPELEPIHLDFGLLAAGVGRADRVDAGLAGGRPDRLGPRRAAARRSDPLDRRHRLPAVDRIGAVSGAAATSPVPSVRAQDHDRDRPPGGRSASCSPSPATACGAWSSCRSLGWRSSPTILIGFGSWRPQLRFSLRAAATSRASPCRWLCNRSGNSDQRRAAEGDPRPVHRHPGSRHFRLRPGDRSNSLPSAFSGRSS